MDGVRILLDGVCTQVASYAQTPEQLRKYLQNNIPDAVGFTHPHPDHFDSDYVAFYRKNTGKTEILPDDKLEECRVGDVRIIPILTRHIGKTDPNLIHWSYLLCGSQRVLFVGDASPLNWRAEMFAEKVDVLIAPFAYLTTPAGIRAAITTGAKHFVLVHMPFEKPDSYGIWEAVEQAIGKPLPFSVAIPDMGQPCIF